MAEARAFWVTAPGAGAIRGEPLPTPGPGDVLVEALASGVSRGTEALVFHGRVPEELHAEMAMPHMGGHFPAPVKLGYASVGVAAGRRVFCLHPHQDRYVVPQSEVVPVPDAVPTARAVLGANMETALNAVWDARPGPGDRVTVVGLGVVGALVGRLIARMPGTAVTAVDVDPARADLAETLGLRLVPPGDAPEGQDLVVHTSGTEAGLATALGCAGVEATVLELSWYAEPVAAPLGLTFHPRRLTLRSSQVGRVAPSHRPRWTYRRRLAQALALLDDPPLDALVQQTCPFEALPERLPALLARPGALAVRVTYG